MIPHRRPMLPFMAAFIVALADMPLNIYDYHQRQVGTVQTLPWLTRTMATLTREVASVGRAILVFFEGYGRWRLALTCAILVLALCYQDANAAGYAIVAASPAELREKINKLGTDMEAIVKKARDENRDMTDTDNTSFDQMDSDREKLLAEERRLIKVASFTEGDNRRTAAVPPGRTEPQPEHRTAEQRREARRDHTSAFLGWLMGSKRSQAQAQAMQRLNMNADEKTIQLALAARAPKSLREADMREWENRDYLGVDIISPDTGGHYLVPDEMMRALEVALLAFGGMRETATILRTDTGADLPIPTMNDTANEGVIIGESVEETTELLPTIGQLVLEAYTYSSKKIPVSKEFMQDNNVNFADRVGGLLGERIARITNRHFTVGTGNSQPRGIVTAATNSGITAASGTAVSYDEIVSLTHSVDPAYRANKTGPQAAKFMFHDNLLLALKKIKVPQFSGDTAGYPLWKAGMAGGDPDTIDGYQYVINQHMPLPTTGQKAMIFGALWKYQIRDVRAVEVERLNELRAEFRQVLWLAFSRHDGDLLDAGTHPVKHLTMG